MRHPLPLWSRFDALMLVGLLLMPIVIAILLHVVEG